jgi:hypothetical protein
MILTELGQRFSKDGDRWRCVEPPDLVMLRGGGHEVDGQGFNSLAEALAFLQGASPSSPPNRGP